MPYCYYMDFSEFIMVSPKCYKAICFDGSEYFLPTSQCYWLERNGSFVTVLVSEWILEKKGIKPLVVLEHDISKRMAATIQFNKARGVHQVDLDADVVRSLLEQGMSEEEVQRHLGIDLDTVLRYKQMTGIVDLFKNIDYTPSWEVSDEE